LWMDGVCRAFEVASGSILNTNLKTVILGLGSREGRQIWSLPWLQAVQQAKVYGVIVAPSSLPPCKGYQKPCILTLIFESKKYLI
jgi:hypothetical protein